MAELPTQFTRAKSNVEPEDDDKANAADSHAKVRAVVAKDETLKAWGADSVLIGSYKRQVSIRRVKDVDVLAKFPDLPDDVTPKDLLARVKKVLADEFDTDDETRVKLQDRSVKGGSTPGGPNQLTERRPVTTTTEHGGEPTRDRARRPSDS